MKSQKIKILLLVFCAVAFSSCGKSNKAENEGTQLRAYRLIDDNRTDDAISLLTAEIDSKDQAAADGYDSSNEATELRLTLASAYAKKSGIRIQEIAHAIELAKQISNLKTQQPLNAVETNNTTNQKLTVFSDLALAQIKIIQTISIIPQVSSKNTIYLSQAVRILNSAPNLSPADLIYSAILKVILARTMYESDSFKKVATQIHKENNQCVANFSDFRDHLTRASKILISGYEDIGKAMPEKTNEVNQGKKTIVDLTATLASVDAASIALNSIDTSSLNSLYKKFSIGSQVNTNCETNEAASTN